MSDLNLKLVQMLPQLSKLGDVSELTKRLLAQHPAGLHNVLGVDGSDDPTEVERLLAQFPAFTSPAKPAGMNCRRTLSPGDSQRGLPHGGALRRASPVGSSIRKPRRAFAVHGLRL